MNYWTIQSIEQSENLKNNGFITTAPNLSLAIDPYFKFGYNWISEQMKIRIGVQPPEIKYPIWCWQTWSNNKRKPDLRYSEYKNVKQKLIRIEFELSEDQVLLSDFELWHHVLYESYIGDNEIDCKLFDQLLDKEYKNIKLEDLPENIKQKIIKSWDKIFDLNFSDDYIAHRREDKRIQGTLWQLDIKDVIKIG